MNAKAIVMFVVVTLGLLLGVGLLLWQFGENADKPVADVAGESVHVRGEGEITLVEFSDFQCPACLAVQAPLKQILAKYEGKVKLVYRHFPLLSIHKNAQVAAYASEAADMQGKFWEMHDLLFEKQQEWGGLDNAQDKLVEYARTLELDETKFVADLESQEVKDRVSADLLAATRYRLSGTPTFYLNGVKVEFNQIDSRIQELSN